jgi:phosphate transport system substrate-binding protein
MAFTRGRCTNFDYCSIAESRRDVEVRVGDEFVCPECGKPLKAPQLAAETRSPLVPALIGAGVLVLLGGGIFVGMRLAGGSGRAGAPAPQTAQAPPPALAAQTAPPAAPIAPPANTGAPGGQKQAAIVAPPPPPENVLVRVRGAAGMGAEIVAPLAAAYLGEIGDTSVATAEHGGETRVTGLRGDVRETILLTDDGVGAAFQALGKGEADVVMAPRRITAAEQSALSGLGDMTAAGAEHVVAVDAQAVVVNPANTVASFTKDQLRDLFAGKVKDWSALGAPAGPVVLYASQAAAEDGEANAIDPSPEAGAKALASPQAVASAVAGDPHGVGLVDLPAIGQARAVPVAETGATPVSPTNHAAVASDDYPLAYRLYLYTSPKAQGGFAERFVAYAMSQPGQALVEQHGLASPASKPAAPPAPLTEADRLKAFVAGAKRLAIAFRFQPNSTVLDQYGERDLDRVMNYLVSIHDGGDHLLLAGFADNQGDAAANVAVSKKRADAVAALFEKRGLTPGGVAGFGAELPVADNATEAGRERNRRVEVYIKP